MTYNIKDYGAVGDGNTLNTSVINQVLKTCDENGGGTVIIPCGTFLTGSFELYNNVTLYLEAGAVIKASGKIENFPPIGFYHNEMKETTSLIWALGKENMSIKGEGTIDINSPAFYPDDYPFIQPEFDINVLSEEQKTQLILKKNNDRINQPIFFDKCKSISVSGVKIINSTCWTVTFSHCENIKVTSVTIDNSLNVQNDDGIHFSGCRDAIVSDCNISCADDCIAMTCITDYEARNENIVISDCTLRSCSAAIRIGHNAKRIAVSNLVINETNRAIGIFTNKNSKIEDVLINNVVLQTKILGGDWWGKGEAVMICSMAENSSIDNVNIANISGQCANGIAVYGKSNMKNVSFSNVNLSVYKTENFDILCPFVDMRPYAKDECKEPFLFCVNGVECPERKENCNVEFVNYCIGE